MRPLRAPHVLTSWIALLALLLASLAPGIAHALGQGAGTGPAWVEVCSGHETKWVPVQEQEPDGKSTASHLLAHCPGCVNHGPMLGLPPATGTDPLLPQLGEAFPPAFRDAPRTLHAWSSAQQRAPPASS